MSEDIRRMDEGQLRRAKKLIRGLCANCDGGNCLLLDDGETTGCPQLITYSVLCRYFRAAVLPADRELYADIMEKDTRKRCADCGAPFVPTGSAAAKRSGRGETGADSRRLGPLKPLIQAAFQRPNRGPPIHFPRTPEIAV